MGKFDKLVPEHIRRLAPYTPGKPVQTAARESGVDCIKLASNENPLGPSPLAIAAIQAAAPGSHLYPEIDAAELRDLLAARHAVSPGQVLVTAGSTQFLNMIAHSLLGPGLNAVTSRRSFIVYPIATQAAGGILKQVPMRDDGYDLGALLDAIDENTRVVYIANPNNPTGSLLTPDDIDRFVSRVPEDILIVLDEAYYDFAHYFARARGVEYSRSLDYVRAGRTMVVLRTFSKAHGLAGLRVGYGFGPEELISYFARERTTFSVSSLAQAAALAALDDDQHIRKTLENNAAGVPWLAGHLARLGLRVAPTWANFLYVEVGEHAPTIAQRMQGEGVIVRPLTGAWGAPQALRITVGTPAENERCVAALSAAMDDALALEAPGVGCR